MSAAAVASRAPLGGRCLRQATTGLLRVNVHPRYPAIPLHGVIRIQHWQLRHKSSLTPKEKDKSVEPERPKITFRQFAGRSLASGLRNIARTLSPQSIRNAFRDSPASMTLTVLFVFGTFVFCTVLVVDFFRTFYTSYFSKFPEPLATTLRRAIYYSNYRPDPDLALKYYKKALEQCAEIGLDPFSDEVLGIRIQISAWLEQIKNPKTAVEVLESVLKDCKKWVEVMDQTVKDGKVNAAGRLIDTTKVSQDKAAEKPAADGQEKSTEPPPETLWRKRERILAKAVGTSVKLGELYADEHVLDQDKSHERLLWALETSLEEFRRRKVHGPRPGEESWLTPQELGGEMESLGRNYESRSQFHLAIPLFFQALRLCDSPCHRAVIMNNLAASFAQHPIYSPAAVEASETLKEIFDSAMPRTRKDCLEAAMNWARNAYTHARDVKGDDRNEECDEACAVALCNWGDVAAILGKPELARKKYEQCIDMSKKMDFSAGVKQAQEGLTKLKK
jgi:tetratricopeptide (TPR) repeat protein